MARRLNSVAEGRLRHCWCSFQLPGFVIYILYAMPCAGFEFTEKLALRVEDRFPGIGLYLPQRNAEINDKQNKDAQITAAAIYIADTKELLSSDILIACIDGVEIDSGVACEIGIAAGWNESSHVKPIHIIGLYTDMRQYRSGDNHFYRNLYVTGAIGQYGVIVPSLDGLIVALGNYIDGHDLPIRREQPGFSEADKRVHDRETCSGNEL